MTPSNTRPAPAADGVGERLTAREQMQLELLDELPARLEPEALAAILRLHEHGRTPSTIGRLMRLHHLVVILELRRELQRRVQQNAMSETDPDEDAKLPRLTSREWNKVVEGGHIPNQPIREMFQTAIRRPGLSERSVLEQANVRDVTHAKRLLGLEAYQGAKRPGEIIDCKTAARIADALGRDPAEVPGL